MHEGMVEPVLAETLFFFSSRRRHTRSLCDWSSDVCSSDLHSRAVLQGLSRVPMGAACRRGDAVARRSEERRVGKEWRCRTWICHIKENDEQTKFVSDLFDQIGKTVTTEENLMDAATVLGAC